MMRWLKRYFKKPEEKAHDYTEDNFREALQKFVPMGNSESDILNEIETITFSKAKPADIHSRPLDVTVKWRRLNYTTRYTINYRSYGNEYAFEELCCVIKSGYDYYRKTIMEELTKKIGDVTADG